MKVIGSDKLYGYNELLEKFKASTNSEVRSHPGIFVQDYISLAKIISGLQFYNRHHLFLFRGQDNDYRNKSQNTSIKPAIMRASSTPTKVPSAKTLKERFDILREAEEKLIYEYTKEKFKFRKYLVKQRIIRWTLLQHYEICNTPLLDLTQSLRIAASFASIGSQDEAFIYVLGVPNVSGGITASAEAGLQIVRVSSVCPPSALRPHIQEAYLVGEYPDMGDFEQKELYKHSEMDFGRRLVAKFKFSPGSFWKKRAFPKIPENALYPNRYDPLYKMATKIKKQIYS